MCGTDKLSCEFDAFYSMERFSTSKQNFKKLTVFERGRKDGMGNSCHPLYYEVIENYKNISNKAVFFH